MQSIKTYRLSYFVVTVTWLCDIWLCDIWLCDILRRGYVTRDYVTACDVWSCDMWLCNTVLWHAFMWHYVAFVYVTCELMWHVPLSFFSCVHLFSELDRISTLRGTLKEKEGTTAVFFFDILCVMQTSRCISLKTLCWGHFEC